MRKIARELEKFYNTAETTQVFAKQIAYTAETTQVFQMCCFCSKRKFQEWISSSYWMLYELFFAPNDTSWLNMSKSTSNSKWPKLLHMLFLY